MRNTLMLAATAAMALVGSAASATTLIDFNAAASGFGFASYVDSGVTFTTSTPGTFSITSTPNGSEGLLSDGTPRPTLRADIAGGATFVSIDLGDLGADSDGLFLDIYNASDVLLGHTDLTIDGSFVGMKTLSLSASGIAYAIFGSGPPSLSGSSVYADNFAFDAAPAGVPEPAAWTLMLAGFFGLGSALRRKAARA